MCRLLAWHSPTAQTAEQVISPDYHRLANLSRVHCDGWGFAQLTESGVIDTQMSEKPAHESPEFYQISNHVATSNGVIHLRWATGDLAVSLGNTHPFTTTTSLGDVAFVHNGFLPDADALLEDIDPAIVSAFRGDTDSERYFGLFATELLRENGDLVAALRRTAKRLADHPYTSLNAMILTPQKIAVLCLFKPEFRPLDEEEDYFNLTWGEQDGVVSAWSTGVRPSATVGAPLENGTLLLIDTQTGATDLVPIT